jgi:hypothetical protein
MVKINYINNSQGYFQNLYRCNLSLVYYVNYWNDMKEYVFCDEAVNKLTRMSIATTNDNKKYVQYKGQYDKHYLRK